jgi:hypothetical protein
MQLDPTLIETLIAFSLHTNFDFHEQLVFYK